ncbi:hypothetical protein D5018_15365 [Parashewanella curva]|uniref:Lipoprotein n=1 Tax=Parashewanella curva TaxID=2338552 RepID=A0A3L8PVM2_9GAMM|nr:hypothetical protein [Parashewanella curva]RLV58829.1 hypothetical protein D5018_15365 [Parashewanella curva]
MKHSIALLLSMLIIGCSSTPKIEEVSFCFNSREEARNTAIYLMDNGFTKRTRYLIDGTFQTISGLGLFWDGFIKTGKCSNSPAALKISYQPKSNVSFSNQVMSSAIATYKVMLREKSAL